MNRQRFDLPRLQLDLVEASIVELPERVEAIVSPDDNHLTAGGGASRAIWAAAGAELERYVARHRPTLKVGELWRSPAGRLRATEVFHAITLDIDRYEPATPRELLHLYRVLLRTAADEGLAKIATPLLGAGAADRRDESCVALATAALEHVRSRPERSVVVLVTVPEDFERVADALRWRLIEGPSAEDVRGFGATPEYTLDVALRSLLVRLCEALKLGADGAPPPLHARAGHVEVDAEGGTPAELAAALRWVLARTEAPLPSELVALLEDAIAARSRLVHARVGDPLEERSTIVDALVRLERHAERVLRARPELAAKVAEPPPDRWPTAADLPRAEEAPAPPVRRTRVVPDETQPVHRLRRILVTHLSDRRRAQLLRRLETRKFAGPDEMRILEYCVTEPDLVELLTRDFTVGDLHEILTAETGRTTPEDRPHEEIARDLLAALGFPARPEIRGLAGARALLEAKRDIVAHGSLVVVKAEVVDATAELERLLKLYIHFLCNWIFDSAPEVLLHANGWLKPSQTLDRATLGTLVHVCGSLEAELRRSTDPSVQEIRRDLPDRPLLPDIAQKLAQWRNEVVHWDRGEEPLSERVVRERGGLFLDGALELIDHLQAPGRTFPHVIRVERVVVDHYGRRVIEAKSEERGAEERIFTSGEIRPGQVYLMRPLTNPLRVDPVLVPAGFLSVKRASEE